MSTNFTSISNKTNDRQRINILMTGQKSKSTIPTSESTIKSSYYMPSQQELLQQAQHRNRLIEHLNQLQNNKYSLQYTNSDDNDKYDNFSNYSKTPVNNRNLLNDTIKSPSITKLSLSRSTQMNKNFDSYMQSFNLKKVKTNKLLSTENLHLINQSKSLNTNLNLMDCSSSFINKSLYKINQDVNPEVVIKTPKQKIEYVQELAIRYLRPTTPPTPGDIIVNQLPNISIPPAPPIILRQIPPRPKTPKALVIREAPPLPPGKIPRKIIKISGQKLPPPPRKVVVERLPPLPTKPQSVIIERWLPFAKNNKRRVIYNKPTEPDPVVIKPKNVVVQWEPPSVQIKREFKYLGVVKANPCDYMNRYRETVKSPNTLTNMVTEIFKNKNEPNNSFSRLPSPSRSSSNKSAPRQSSNRRRYIDRLNSTPEDRAPFGKIHIETFIRSKQDLSQQNIENEFIINRNEAIKARLFDTDSPILPSQGRSNNNTIKTRSSSLSTSQFLPKKSFLNSYLDTINNSLDNYELNLSKANKNTLSQSKQTVPFSMYGSTYDNETNQIPPTRRLSKLSSSNAQLSSRNTCEADKNSINSKAQQHYNSTNSINNNNTTSYQSNYITDDNLNNREDNCSSNLLTSIYFIGPSGGGSTIDNSGQSDFTFTSFNKSTSSTMVNTNNEANLINNNNNDSHFVKCTKNPLTSTAIDNGIVDSFDLYATLWNRNRNQNNSFNASRNFNEFSV